MGLHGMSIGSWLIILLIVAILFGTKRFRSIGKDLGAGLRSFRQGLKEEPVETSETTKPATDTPKE